MVKFKYEIKDDFLAIWKAKVWARGRYGGHCGFGKVDTLGIFPWLG
jgi:hypothetical protein